MAATSMPIPSPANIELSDLGGNAVDAAVAACAVLAVVEPQSTGLGDDCFCLYAPPGGDKVVAINGSGRTTRRHTASPSPAPSPGGNCCWRPTGPRALTNCFFPPSTARRTAFRCTS